MNTDTYLPKCTTSNDLECLKVLSLKSELLYLCDDWLSWNERKFDYKLH